MLFRVILPLIFIGLVVGISGRQGRGPVQHALVMLLVRFVRQPCLRGDVARSYLAAALPPRPTRAVIGWTALVGITLHSTYLGSVFFAISLGLPAGIAALIVSLQPLLASGLAIFLFGERLRAIQIGGMLAGLAGVFLVLLPKMGGGMPALGLASVCFGLCAVTFGTLLQKQIGGKIDLLVSNLVQTVAASAFLAVICLTVETPRIAWEMPFILSLAWQVVMVSAGAYVILMVLIQRDTMASVSSLMFLVPPTTAVIAAVGFNEPLTGLGIVGFA